MSGLPGPPDPDDPAVLDPEVGLHDAEERVDDDHRADHRVELARGGGGVVLGHPGAPVLRVAPQRLVARLGQVLLDAEPQVGVADPHAVACGRAVPEGVLVARQPVRHLACPPRATSVTSLTSPGAHRERVAGGQVQPESPRRLAVERERRVRVPEREVARDPHRSRAGVRDRERPALSVCDERHVARAEPDARLAGAEGLAQHHEPRALIEQHLEADLRHELRDAVQHRCRGGDRPAGLQDLLPRLAAAR